MHPETPRGGAHLSGRLGNRVRAAAYADNVLALARASGLSMRRANSGASSARCELQAAGEVRAYAALVDRVTHEARADEVLSTPTCIFSGGFRMTGAQDYAVLESVTRRLLDRGVRG